MPYHCGIKDCNSGKNCSNSEETEKIGMHTFPKKEETKQRWMQILSGRTKTEKFGNYFRICSKHFTPSCFTKVGFGKVKLNETAFPTIFLTDRDINNEEHIASLENDTVASSTHADVPILKEEMSVAHNDGNDMPELPQDSHNSNRSIRYAGDISEHKLQNMSPTNLRECIRVLQGRISKQSVAIKTLRRHKQRSQKRIATITKIVNELKKSGRLSSNAADVLKIVAENDLHRVIGNGKLKGKYTPELRAFALTLNFYSPRAYHYVRKRFKNNLPAASTIRSWYSHMHGAPGLSEEAHEILKRKSQHKKIYACLMMDEMAIRKEIAWNHQEKRYVGYIDMGTSIPRDHELPAANNALVYLLNGVNDRWKIPVAYFFINSLTAEEKANITMQVLQFLAPTGVCIVAMTFDGCAANLAMCTALSADIYNSKAFFKHPTDDYDVHIILDAAHMLKLIRNTLASKGILYDANNIAIQWAFVENLVKIQDHGCFHLANKINKKHIAWFKNKMNVKLAAQVFSESVATSIEQLLYDKHPHFVNSEATTRFIRMVNTAFDILNSRSLIAYGFKQPIMASTFEKVYIFIQQAIEYFSNIKCTENGPLVIHSRSKTGFIGFINNLKSVLTIYERFVDGHALKYLLTYKLSQDHLETFFSCIRSLGGYNNNPSTTHFSAAYKKLLHHNEVKSSASANCTNLEEINILTIPSRRKNVLEENIDTDLMVKDVPLPILNTANMHSTAYIAGYVEMQILKIIQCDICIQLLQDSKRTTSEFIKRKSAGYLHYPAHDTNVVCIQAEQIFKLCVLNKKITEKHSFYKIQNTVLRTLNLNNLFINFNTHIHNLGPLENHKYALIKLIIQCYLKIKFYYMGKVYTREEVSNYIRHNFTKQILFNGQ